MELHKLKRDERHLPGIGLCWPEGANTRRIEIYTANAHALLTEAGALVTLGLKPEEIVILLPRPERGVFIVTRWIGKERSDGPDGAPVYEKFLKGKLVIAGTCTGGGMRVLSEDELQARRSTLTQQAEAAVLARRLRETQRALEAGTRFPIPVRRILLKKPPPGTR